MPCVYMFEGWKIYMYYEDHTPPHFHLLNPENEFRVHLNGELHSVVRGNSRLVNWKFINQLAERNQTQLEHNWIVTQHGGTFLNLT